MHKHYLTPKEIGERISSKREFIELFGLKGRCLKLIQDESIYHQKSRLHMTL